jgi:hypothetical protein
MKLTVQEFEALSTERKAALDRCKCGRGRDEHYGLQGHGACVATGCRQFTWSHFDFEWADSK